MNVNKVIDLNGNVIIDLSKDTVESKSVLAGVKFHGADGKQYTGTLIKDEIESLKYKFYDYDGTLLYSFSDSELDALTVLPNPPSHSEENLAFQNWNWTLDELKAWDRNRVDRPIVGAYYITEDGKTYITLTTSPANEEEAFCFGYISSTTSLRPTLKIDWGDGSAVQTSTISSANIKLSHKFPAANTEYTVVIEITANASNCAFGTNAASTQSGRTQGYGVSSLKLGNFGYIGRNNKITMSQNLNKLNIPESLSFTYGMQSLGIKYITYPKKVRTNLSGDCGFENCYSLKRISFPSNITDENTSARNLTRILVETLAEEAVLPLNMNGIGDYFFRNTNLKNITIQENITDIAQYAFQGCYELKSVIFEGESQLTSIGNYAFNNCRELASFDMPNGVTSIGQIAFAFCVSLEELKIPDSVTSISQNAFQNCYKLTLDLTEQTKVIPLTSAPGLNVSYNKILVPATLLDQYKSASYWSNFASIMVGV